MPPSLVVTETIRPCSSSSPALYVTFFPISLLACTNGVSESVDEPPPVLESAPLKIAEILPGVISLPSANTNTTSPSTNFSDSIVPVPSFDNRLTRLHPVSLSAHAISLLCQQK